MDETLSAVEPQFWMVWCPQGGPPTVRHFSLEAAKAEAERLAVNNPDRDFYVLKEVGRCHCHLPVVWGYPDDEPPF